MWWIVILEALTLIFKVSKLGFLAIERLDDSFSVEDGQCLNSR